MSKFDAVVDRCVAQMDEQGIQVDRDLLTAIAKSLGPSLYRQDAILVAASQPSELDTIKKNFLIGKLGCDDGPALDDAIAAAIEKIGTSRRNKLRPVFYYLLVTALGKESVYAWSALGRIRTCAHGSGGRCSIP